MAPRPRFADRTMEFVHWRARRRPNMTIHEYDIFEGPPEQPNVFHNYDPFAEWDREGEE